MAGSLEFIKSSTLTTSASEFLVTDCFNKGYDAYEILITNEIRSATGYGWLRLLDSSGSELSGSYYSGAGLHIYSSSGGSDRYEPVRTEWKNFINYQGKDNPDMGGIKIMMYNPDDSSSYTFFTSQASTHYTGQFLTAVKSAGVYKNAEIVYGIKWYPQSGTINGTKITVYGVK